MARSEHRPIYKAAYDLCLCFEPVVYRFSRYHKYAIGVHSRGGSLRVLWFVVRANARFVKAPVLYRLREELEELKVLIRLCHEAKAFPNFSSFEHSIGLVTDISLALPVSRCIREPRSPLPPSMKMISTLRRTPCTR